MSHAKEAEKTQYLKLFYAIDKLDECSDELLKKKLKGNSFIKHLPVTKNYLFNAILKQLKAYRSDFLINDTLIELLRDADILVRKTLYKEGYKILRKAAELAEKYELFLFCLEIYDRILALNYDLPANEKTISESFDIYNKQITVLNKYTEIVEQKKLQTRRGEILCASLKPEEQEKKLKALLQEPLLKEDFNFSSYSSGLYHYHTKGLIHVHYHDTHTGRGYKVNKKFVEHLESNPDLLRVNMARYSSSVNNFMLCQLTLKKYDEFKTTVKKLTELKPENEYLNYRIKEKVIGLMLVYYIFTHNYEEGKTYILKNEKDLVENENLYGRSFLMAIVDSCCVIHFMLKEYSMALKWVNRILNYKGNIRYEIQGVARLINLLIHYELKNYDHVEYLLKPTTTFLKKHNLYHEYEKEIISFFGRVVELNKEIEIKREFSKIAESLKKYRQSARELEMFIFFDMPGWFATKAK